MNLNVVQRASRTPISEVTYCFVDLREDKHRSRMIPLVKQTKESRQYSEGSRK